MPPSRAQPARIDARCSAAGTGIVTDSGTGLNSYRLGTDGVWRVAREARATDQPAAAPAP